MKVLNLTTNADARFLSLQVRALEERGVECTTVSVPGSHLAGSPRSPIDYVKFYPRVLRAVAADCDVVHANYGLVGPFALAQPRRPVVLSLWGSDLYGTVGRVSRLSAPLFDAVVVMSERMRRDLGRDCFVVPHGVDLDGFAPVDREAACAELGWDPTVHNVLFPYDTNRAVKNYPLAERVAAAADRELDRPVELRTVSGLPHDRMPTVLSAAAALLLTSHSEGSPNTVKEAMACNLPVVSTDVGDVRERLAGVEPSTVCRTERSLVAGLVDVLDRGERSNGREHVESVALQQTTDRLVEVYKRVLDGRPRGSPF